MRVPHVVVLRMTRLPFSDRLLELSTILLCLSCQNVSGAGLTEKLSSQSVIVIEPTAKTVDGTGEGGD
jgi:hypothetical protein